jgi:hypothetical protein
MKCYKKHNKLSSKNRKIARPFQNSGSLLAANSIFSAEIIEFVGLGNTW